MTRLDLAPDNELVALLKKALADIETLKQAQRLGGDSVVPQILETSSVYDFDSFYDGTYYSIAIDIKFTAETQLNPYIFPVLKFFDMSGNALSSAGFTLYETNYLAALYDYTGSLSPNYDDKIAYNYVAGIRTAAPFRGKLYLFASDRGTYITQQI